VQSLQRIERALLRDQAYELLRDAIVTGILEPGALIRDIDLAAQMGLSQGPVRAALSRLRDEGLVESKPQSHTRVTPLVVRDVRDAVAVVRAMHEVAVREAASHMTPIHLAAMRAANICFTRAVALGAIDDAIAADDVFHDVPVVVCGNRAVAATIDRYTPLIRRLERRKFTSVPGQLSVQLHERLIAALADADVDAAVLVTREIWSELEGQIVRDEVDDVDDTLPIRPSTDRSAQPPPTQRS
jgi:DNA-binding GntR family transcriptional regulator